MNRAPLLVALSLPLPAAYLAADRPAGGTVTDTGGQPVAGVTVTATRPDGVVGYSVVTDGAGASTPRE